jgi:hypothetical protein
MVTMRRLLLFAMLPLAGCATMSGQPLHVACLACSTLAASGVCASRELATQPVPASCPSGQELWITNWSAFVERGARPVIACAPVRSGNDLP